MRRMGRFWTSDKGRVWSLLVLRCCCSRTWRYFCVDYGHGSHRRELVLFRVRTAEEATLYSKCMGGVLWMVPSTFCLGRIQPENIYSSHLLRHQD